MRKVFICSWIILLSLIWSTVVIFADALPILTPQAFEARWGLINSAGKTVLKTEYSGLGQLVDGLAPVQMGEKQGYLNVRGEMVIKPQYTFADAFSEGLARVNTGGEFYGQFPKGGKWGFIDNKGRTVVELKYEWAEPFSGGLAKVIEAGKIKYINKQGTVVFDCIYSEAGNFSEGFTWVRSQNGSYYFIDQYGKTVANSKWPLRPGKFSEGLAVVSSNGKDGYIDTKMKLVIPHHYDVGGNFSGGLARVRSNGKWGFIDTKGTTVIALSYDFVESFSEGLALVRVEEKVGYINTQGQVVITPQYDDGLSFAGGLAAVYEKEKGWGFVDKRGQIVVPLTWSAVRSFSSGVAQVATPSGWGYVNEAKELVIPALFDQAYEFLPNGLAKVEQDEKMGWIDPTGRVVIPLHYTGSSGWVNDLLAVSATNGCYPMDVVFYQPNGSILRSFAQLLQENEASVSYLLQDTYTVMASGLNMRKSADLKAEKVTTIPYGAEVKILERTGLALTVEGIDGFWAKVEYQGVEGYVYDGFLTRLPAVNLEAHMGYDPYFGPIQTYCGQLLENVEQFDIRFDTENRLIKLKIGDSGIISGEACYTDLPERMLYYYLSGVSVREVFLLLRVLYSDELVALANDQQLPAETRLKSLNLPDFRSVTIEFTRGWIVTIEESPDGYVLVSFI